MWCCAVQLRGRRAALSPDWQIMAELQLASCYWYVFIIYSCSEAGHILRLNHTVINWHTPHSSLAGSQSLWGLISTIIITCWNALQSDNQIKMLQFVSLKGLKIYDDWRRPLNWCHTPLSSRLCPDRNSSQPLSQCQWGHRSFSCAQLVHHPQPTWQSHAELHASTCFLNIEVGSSWHFLSFQKPVVGLAVSFTLVMTSRRGSD